MARGIDTASHLGALKTGTIAVLAGGINNIYPKENKEQIPQYKIIQEKLVHDYMMNWFTISANQETNNLRWQDCTDQECEGPEQFDPSNIKCALSCKSAPALFEEFYDDVLPEYTARVETGNERWNVDSIIITQNIVSEKSGRWQVYAVVVSNVSGPFNVLAFVDVERDVKKYPATFGYYIKNFNAYRINNE